MKYLLDTCVISEIIKPKPNKNVISWVQNKKSNSLYLSVLSLGEIEKGIEKSPSDIRKNKLKLWLEDDLKKHFQGRIIPIDVEIATRWGNLQGIAELRGKPMPTVDGLIAVSGLVRHCIVVTRNVSDMQQSSAELFNPWLDSN
ncbi:MAG: type II toxin-antitoxin system VapC family toxin [Methylococcales bacterium]|nr:type II toxin-antitoxin system VapC family toxin [Methylococcales bacterium]MBT7408483.1 type II toxin-antitoxin system VapC family toxin [Methylococcales bacterium]